MDVVVLIISIGCAGVCAFLVVENAKMTLETRKLLKQSKQQSKREPDKLADFRNYRDLFTNKVRPRK